MKYRSQLATGARDEPEETTYFITTVGTDFESKPGPIASGLGTHTRKAINDTVPNTEVLVCNEI